jgi:uncharacterized membrane protein
VSLSAHISHLYHVLLDALSASEWIIAPLNKYIMTFTRIARRAAPLYATVFVFQFCVAAAAYTRRRERERGAADGESGTRVRYTAIAKTIISAVRIGFQNGMGDQF